MVSWEWTTTQIFFIWKFFLFWWSETNHKFSFWIVLAKIFLLTFDDQIQVNPWRVDLFKWRWKLMPPNLYNKSPTWVCLSVPPRISGTPCPMIVKFCMRNLLIIWKISTEKKFENSKKKNFAIFFFFQNFFQIFFQIFGG